jgi:hypothetical protein
MRSTGTLARRSAQAPPAQGARSVSFTASLKTRAPKKPTGLPLAGPDLRVALVGGGGGGGSAVERLTPPTWCRGNGHVLRAPH